MTDYTRQDAELDIVLDRIDRETQLRKSEVMNSAVEMGHLLRFTDQTNNKLYLKIAKLFGNLIDAGLELSNPHYHEDLPAQVKEMVIELAEAGEQAIEEFISE